MTELPKPPDAYWVNVPWWGYLGFLLMALVVSLVVAPWVIQRARSKPSAMLSREQALTARELAQQAREDAERLKLEVDCERGWDLARGWAAIAHPLWHQTANAVQAHNGLLLVCQRILDGRLVNDAARDRLGDFPPLPSPAPLPADIELAAGKKAGETKYA